MRRKGILEDPDTTPPSDMWLMTEDPIKAPGNTLDITIRFDKGIPMRLQTPQGVFEDSVELFEKLNQIGKEHGIGRIDIVENRFIGLKSRGCYDCMCSFR